MRSKAVTESPFTEVAKDMCKTKCYDAEFDTLYLLSGSSYAPVQSMVYITTELWMEHLAKVSLVW